MIYHWKEHLQEIVCDINLGQLPHYCANYSYQKIGHFQCIYYVDKIEWISKTLHQSTYPTSGYGVARGWYQAIEGCGITSRWLNGAKNDLKANLWEKCSTTCNLADFASGHKKVILSPKLFQLIQFGSFNVLEVRSAALCEFFEFGEFRLWWEKSYVWFLQQYFIAVTFG